MNEGRGSSSDEPAPDDLEVIELEASDGETRHADATGETLQRRRGPVVIAALVVVALVGVTITSRTRHSSRRATATTTNASHTNIDLNNRPTPTAPLFSLNVGAQVLTGGLSGLRVVDTDTGRQSTPDISGLPPGPVTIVAHSGTTVAVRVDSGLYWFSMPRAVAHFAEGGTAFAATRSGYLWIAGERAATEVPGEVNVVHTNGPAIGATSAGLLVVTKAGVSLQPISGAGAIRLLIGAPATVIGVAADRVAWVTNDCGVLRCPVHITEVATGASSSWLQLVGHPSPLAVAGTSAVFSPDGGSIAIVEPNDDVTDAATVVVANLRTRATTVVAADKQFEQPARPGSHDGSGATIDWTRDGQYLVFGAPSEGANHVGMMEPTVALISPGGPVLGAGTSVAAIGSSTVKSIHPPARTEPPIDTGGPTPLDLAGLHLIGIDGARADVIDLDTNRDTAFPTAGPVPITPGHHTVARVVGGWIVVRISGAGSVVDLLRDDGSATREIAPGSEVFSSDAGRHAWIVDVDGSAVRPYDPVTARLGRRVVISGQMVTTDAALVVGVERFSTTGLDLIDASGRLYPAHAIEATGVEFVAGAGTKIAYTDFAGFHVYDLTTGGNQVISQAPVVAAALSPDGNAIAWIESVTHTTVLARRLNGAGGASVNAFLGGPVDQVLIADNGTVLFTNGSELFQGRDNTGGASAVSGFAPAPNALLGLG